MRSGEEDTTWEAVGLSWGNFRSRQDVRELRVRYDKLVGQDIAHLKQRVEVLESAERRRIAATRKILIKAYNASREAVSKADDPPNGSSLSLHLPNLPEKCSPAEEEAGSMVYPRRQVPELPYPAARALEKASLELAGIVAIPQENGEEFASRCRKLVKDLANIRRIVAATKAVGGSARQEA